LTSYKSEILPLYEKFLEYDKDDDFIGMDMARKFLQMGMTRAKRYANHAGGRKYDKKTGSELEKSENHEGREDKVQASLIFREIWEKAKACEGYIEKKERFQQEQKEYDKAQKEQKK
jgi:hypothetical protein